MHYKLTTTPEDIGRRLDTVIARHLPDQSRSQIKRWIDSDIVRVNQTIPTPAVGTVKTSYKIKQGDEIVIKVEPPRELAAEPQDIPLDILYEDSDIVVVNKLADMVVHPAVGNPDGTLVNALLYHCRDLSGIGGVLRPGIVHRLDKGTSGVIVTAKNDMAHKALTEQFKERKTRKIYLALIYGVPKAKKGIFNRDIGRHPTDRKRMSTKTRRGRTAVTEWEVVQSFDKHISLVKIRLITGRTHQIRVHFSAAGMPLVGDMVYGGKKTIKRLPEGRYRDIVAKAGRAMLHAEAIEFVHPRSGERVRFTAGLPQDFREITEALRAISF